MHLLFVEASNKKVADLQEACKLRQLEIEALRQEREAEKKDRNRCVAREREGGRARCARIHSH